MWLPLKLCYLDRHFTYLVWNIISNLNIRNKHMYFIAPSGYLFKKGAKFPMCSPCYDFANTLVSFRPENAFFEPIPNSIIGVISLSKLVKYVFRILSSTKSTIIPNSLSIYWLKYISKVPTFAETSLANKLLSGLPTVISWSPVHSLTYHYLHYRSQFCQKKNLERNLLIG